MEQIMTTVLEYENMGLYGIIRKVDIDDAKPGFFNNEDELYQYLNLDNFNTICLGNNDRILVFDELIKNIYKDFVKEYSINSKVDITEIVKNHILELYLATNDTILNVSNAIAHAMNCFQSEYKFNYSYNDKCIKIRKLKPNSKHLKPTQFKTIFGKFVKELIEESNPTLSHFLKNAKVSKSNEKEIFDLMESLIDNGIVRKSKFPKLYAFLENSKIPQHPYYHDGLKYINIEEKLTEVKNEHKKLLTNDLHYLDLFVIFVFGHTVHGVTNSNETFKNLTFDEIKELVSKTFDAIKNK
jgi:hypothetical protein